jgi:hypothetical protein
MEHLVPDDGDRRKLMRWVVTLIARPDVRMRYGVLNISEAQRVGKTTLALILEHLVGRHNTSYVTEQMMESQFTDWIAHKQLVICSEIYSGQKRKMYDRLKDKITDDTVRVNKKFIAPYDVECRASFYATSNSLRALHLDDVDMRWLAPHVTEDASTKEYWDRFYAWLHGDGFGVILHHLQELARDPEMVVGTGEPAPMTARKEEIIGESMSDGQRLARDLAVFVQGLKDASGEPAKILFAVEDVRAWVRTCRGLRQDNDDKLEKASTLLKTMKQAGMHEPKVKAGETRKRFYVEVIDVNGRPQTINGKVQWYASYVVATFPIEAGTKWADIKTHRMNPSEVFFMNFTPDPPDPAASADEPGEPTDGTT